MSDRPGSAGSVTQETRFGWFLRTASESDTRTCPLRPQADSVRRARQITRATLRQWGLSELTDDASLVVSELVTNAIRYARYPVGEWSDHPITLVLLRIAPHVMLAVSDPSDRAPAPKEPDIVSEHGRGLYIVETYSQAWGWDPLDHGGKAVWAILRGSD